MVLFYRLIKEDILVKLRLTRIGRHKRPFYRLIAADARSKANGKFIEQLGHYDPISKVSKFDKESILKLLLNGAVPTETVKNLFSKEGIWAEYIKAKNDNLTNKPKVEKIAKAKKPAKAKVDKTKTVKVEKPKAAKVEKIETVKVEKPKAAKVEKTETVKVEKPKAAKVEKAKSKIKDK